jgi:hypothetical protein
MFQTSQIERERILEYLSTILNKATTWLMLYPFYLVLSFTMSRISNLILELRMNYHQSGPSTSEQSVDSEVFLSYFRCLMFDPRQQEVLLSWVL